MNSYILPFAIVLTLASLIPFSHCIRRPSFTSSIVKPSSSITFPIYHRSHPEIQSYFDDSNVVANFSGKFADHLYYVKVLFGTPPTPMALVFDTGSMFTWINVTTEFDPFIASNTYAQVSSSERLCQEVPNNNYDEKGGDLNDCQYRLPYAGGTYSKGDVARDRFYLFEADGGVGGHSPVVVNMTYGASTEGNTDKKGVMGVSTHPLGLMTALNVKHMSMCFPKNFSKTSLVRFGSDSLILGGFTPLIKETHKWIFKVDSISVEGSSPSGGGSISGDKFIFDTGAPMTFLKSDLMDVFIKLVDNSVDAEQLSPYRGYELCYDNSVTKKKLIISFELAGGGGTLNFRSESIWENFNIDSCLAFARSPESLNKNIFGAKQMPGWEIGVDVTESELYFDEVDC